jgi:Copper transport outer membrane protein, MctB
VIDFRFFLISIVAVFLALGIGIVMGSAVLGGPILQGLENRAEGVLERNDALREQIADLEQEQAELQEFADTVEAGLINGELTGQEVVLIEAEGTDGQLIDSIDNLVEEADGRLSTRIMLNDKFALPEGADAQELADALDLPRSAPDDLRAAAGIQIGTRLGASATERATDPKGGFARVDALDMLESLEDTGFISVDRAEEQPIIPSDAFFIVAAGAVGEAPYDVDELVVPMVGRLDVRGTQAVVTEPSDSTWGVVAAVRDDPAVSDQVSTVDHGETVPGRVSIAISLPGERLVGHWGTDDGAEAIVPAPSG